MSVIARLYRSGASYFSKETAVKNLQRNARALAIEQRKAAREIMVDKTMSEYDLVHNFETRIFVPASLLGKDDEIDDEKDRVDCDKNGKASIATSNEGTSAGMASAESVSKIVRKPLRPFKRCVRVFEPSEIARVKNVGKATSGDTKRRFESTIKIAEEHEGYRKLPTFKNIGRTLTRLEGQFGNFRSVLDHFAEEMTLAGASKAEYFRISPVLFDGDPGVGKTAFAQTFASMLGLPFCKLSAGGMQHASILTGTASHWANAQAGEVFNLISHSQWASGVLLIDEADKLSNRQEYAILPALLDLLEPESARKYRDESVGMHFDASRLIVLMASNKMNDMDPALLSRCRTFMIKAPGVEQRISIAKRVHIELKSKARSKRIDLDCYAVRELSEADIDIRALIMAVRSAFARALRTGSKISVPEKPEQKAIQRGIGFIRTEAKAD
ncbi:AAA family ATPase [Sideroxydans sp. CL21]|uniref:AAA family ATPase n=1 Tax=Sideroxydans sp. CL21 TaxID=2600596 RepID=UPI0024BD12A0|nr:AAA family ATPase [Sideroxydans sp. CL21]